VLKSCAASTCRLPWNVLHQNGQVKNLRDALAPEFDSFYENQPKVAFAWCDLGYVVAAEGPMRANYFGGGSANGYIGREEGDLRELRDWFDGGGIESGSLEEIIG
jgi:hypothetical protein